MDLSLNLRAIVSQRLIISKEGSRVPAVEVMLNSPFISDLIAKGDISGIKDAMKESTNEGIVTFDQALITLYNEGKITYEEAVANADSKNDISLAIRMGDDSTSSQAESNLLF